MHWVYLSPHFDDAALSCGGLIWEQTRAGDEVSVWTICAGEPSEGDLSPFAMQLHARWNAGQNAPAKGAKRASQGTKRSEGAGGPAHRKLEDARSCQLLGASTRYFNIPDCIYRRHPQTGEFLYASEESLNGPIHPGDTQTIMILQEQLKPLISNEMVLVSPLALGNHVDHQLTRAAAGGLECLSWYYQDYPYVLRSAEQLEGVQSLGWSSQIFPVSEQGLLVWQDSVAAHASQISTFWSSENEMRQALTVYWRPTGGVPLWSRPHQERAAQKTGRTQNVPH